MVYPNKTKDEYVHKASNYMPSNNERLNGIAEGKALEKHLVPLLFLVKKSSHAQSVLESIPPTFYAPDLPMYTKARMYREHDLSIKTSELRLEFYCCVLKMFSSPGNKFLLIIAGTKPMLAGIVSFTSSSFLSYHLAQVELNKQVLWISISYPCTQYSCISALDRYLARLELKNGL